MPDIMSQIALNSPYVSSISCRKCMCSNCLYWWSSRCPYGGCYDNERAKVLPFHMAHPEAGIRKLWSGWQKEQAFWCRGGTFYPSIYCEHYEQYEGQEIIECVACNIAVFQDGYVSCTLKEHMTCEECIARQENKTVTEYECSYMTDTGCNRMISAKDLMLQEIIENGEIEMCKEQCCIGCKKICGYRCGQAYKK